MNELSKVVVLIPSLEPDEMMVRYINELSEAGFDKIILVNDGSSKEYDKLFLKVKEKVQLLKHAVNSTFPLISRFFRCAMFPNEIFFIFDIVLPK